MKYRIVLPLLLVSSATAVADEQALWESVRGGMSPAEVIAKYPAAKSAADGSAALVLKAGHDSPIPDATLVTFSFRDNGLVEVMVGYLVPRDIEQLYARKKDEMGKLFGKPAKEISDTFGKAVFSECDFVSGESHIKLTKVAGPPNATSFVDEDYEFSANSKPVQ